jgi:cell wall-associated NlpC family hydrolase
MLNKVAMLNKIEELVGIQFVDGGRTPEEGFDCWGLVKWIYHMRGIELPNYPIPADNRDAVNDKMIKELVKWEKIEQPKEGDMVLLELAEGVPNHVGICLRDGDFIHAYGKSVVIDRLRRWNSRVVGFYRPTEESYV